MISHVKFIAIPSRDQDSALSFYRDKLGFKLVTDQPHDQTQRWIELRIGGSDTRVVLFNMGGEIGAGGFAANFACHDVQKTYEEYLARGVEFVSPPSKQAWGEFAVMKDPDGNKLMLSTR